MSEANAVPDRMRDFQQMPDVDLAPLARVTPDACGSGVFTCGKLLAADREATAAVHRFLTHMAQGVVAYRELVARCERTYRDGAEYTAASIANACRYPANEMLPDVVPVLRKQG